VLHSQTYKGNQETKQKIEKKIGSSSLRALTKNVVGLFHPHLMKKKSVSQPAPARRSVAEGGFFNLRVLIGRFVFLALVGFGAFSSAAAQASGSSATRGEGACNPLSEGFDDITNLVPNGWFMQNNSMPLGLTNWFQGNPTVFTGQGGAPNSYIGANWNNGAGLATISNWLLTPVLGLQDGAQLIFWTRTVDVPFAPDRLQVRMSTNGASTDVGTTATSVGDFTNLLLDINPTYLLNGYPNVWTQFTVTLSGIPPGTTGRLAFRYFVENAGPSGDNSDYIGIDTMAYNCSGGPTPTPTPTPPIASPYDFNHDNKPDFVLYNGSTRQTAMWYMHNNVYAGGAFGPILAAGWSLIDVADFNRDGNNDYALFNSSTRQTAIWYPSGNMITGSAWGPTVPSGWALVATGDFNGDSKPDYVLYKASTGQTGVWYLNNNVYAGGAYGPTLPAGWRLAGVADFNGNGRTDYDLFNPSTRQSGIYYLSGTVYVSSALGPTIASGYELKGTADFNGNGKPDNVLYNAGTRRTALYYLNNNVYAGSALGPILPSGWNLVAP
jgi:hypothetical protein